MKTSSRKRDTKNIHKKGNIYYVVVQIQGKRTWFKIGSNLDQAIQERNKIKTLLVTKQFDIVKNAIGKEENQLTYKGALELYRAEHLCTLKSGDVSYRYCKDAIPIFGEKKISTIDMQDIIDYKTKRLQEVQRGTVYNYLSAISTMFNFFHKKGEITENPCLKVDKIKFNNTREEILSHTEFIKLLSASWIYKNRSKEKICYTKNHLRLALIIADHSCCRIGEVLKLKWSDIVDISSGKCFRILLGKGEKSRLVPIHDELLKILDLQKRECKYIIHFNNEPVKSLKTAFKSAKKAIELNDCRIHDFRHRGITRLVQEGHSIPLIKKISGHSSEGAFRRYINLTQNDLSAFFGSRSHYIIPRITLDDYLNITEMCRRNVEMEKVA